MSGPDCEECGEHFLDCKCQEFTDKKMKWVNRKDQEPKHCPILVFCKTCLTTHSVIYDYEEYWLPECCNENGPYSCGASIEFDYWMALPEKPNEMDLC